MNDITLTHRLRAAAVAAEVACKTSQGDRPARIFSLWIGTRGVTVIGEQGAHNRHTERVSWESLATVEVALINAIANVELRVEATAEGTA